LNCIAVCHLYGKLNQKNTQTGTKKNEACNIIVAKYREAEPNADREIMGKKINSLCTNYRKYIKVKSSEKSGCGPEELQKLVQWLKSVV
jgi:hypothetical protein